MSGVPFESHIYLTGNHALSLGRACTADGQAGMINPTVAEWLNQSVVFLETIFRLLPEKQSEFQDDHVMEEKSILDTPLDQLIQRKDTEKLIRELLPDVVDSILENQIVKGFSLHKLSKHMPEIITEEKMKQIENSIR